MFCVILSHLNNGIVSFNALKSWWAPGFVLQGASFRNTGKLFMAGDGDTPPLFTLGAPNWYNSGLIVMYQNNDCRANVNLGAALQTIVNDGSICLHHSFYTQATSIQGRGCFTADSGSTIHIANMFLPISPDQQYYLADPKSSLVVQAFQTPATFNVYGFGNGNMIGLDVSLSLGKKGYSYNPDTGILTLTGGLFNCVTQHFNIGKNYDPRMFERVTDKTSGILWPASLGAIRYNGDVPNKAIPQECYCESPPAWPTSPQQ